MKALQELSTALTALIKSQSMKYVRREIVKRTVFATLWAALTPTVWINLVHIVGMPFSLLLPVSYANTAPQTIHG